MQAAGRVLRPLLGASAFGAGLAGAANDGAPLERTAMRGDLPVVAPCEQLESLGARPVRAAPHSLVAGFLDGIQRSRIVTYVQGTPVVWGTVAAAVRERADRTLRTWRAPAVRRLLLASRDALGDAVWAELEAAGLALVNLTPDLQHGPDNDAQFVHPHALRGRALDEVALERERLERQLAAAWCDDESRWLWIDGGISGNLALTHSAPAFGVIKSHTTLYGDGTAVRTALALREGERSGVFLVGHRPRRAVASWYLRVRAAGHGDPLFGLVRVEVVPPPALLDEPAHDEGRRTLSTLSDVLSSSIMLERNPVSLPDARWDTLSYGVHAVETYLQALVGT